MLTSAFILAGDVRDKELSTITIHAETIALLPIEQCNLVSGNGDNKARSRTPIPSQFHALTFTFGSKNLPVIVLRITRYRPLIQLPTIGGGQDKRQPTGDILESHLKREKERDHVSLRAREACQYCRLLPFIRRHFMSFITKTTKVMSFIDSLVQGVRNRVRRQVENNLPEMSSVLQLGMDRHRKEP